MAGLTVLQQRFAEEYVADRNATRAAVRAGYAEGRAHVTGSELLRHEGVVAEIERLDGGRLLRSGWDAARVVSELEGLKVGAVGDGNWLAAIRAVVEIGRVLGLHAPRRSEVEVQVVYSLDLGRELVGGEVVDVSVIEDGA